MSEPQDTNEAAGGRSDSTAVLADFSAWMDAAALDAYRAYLLKMDGITEEPQDLPEGARELFCDGYWKGYEAASKAANA